MNDLETRLTAALAARADLVRPGDLSHVAPVVPLRRRWTTPLMVLASAACVVLVLALALRLADTTPKADPAPKPDEPALVLPPDEGRDWTADDLSTPAKLDLDGDGIKEKVEFLAEPDPDFQGRTRLQTTLTSTGEEAYGMAQLGSTIGTTALDPIDADDDGDQELVLYRENLDGGPGALMVPLVFDLRDGLLVEAQPSEPNSLVAGYLPIAGSQTTYYDMVRVASYWIENGSLFSSLSVDAFARGNMTLMRPESYVVDAYEWRLGEDGILRAGEPSCLVLVPEAQAPCGSGVEEGFVPYINSVATEAIPEGEWVDFDAGYQFRAAVEPGQPPTLVVDGFDGQELRFPLEVADPVVSTLQPISVFSDGASLIVTSSSDPTFVQTLVQAGDSLVSLVPTGEIALANAGATRTWQTANGALVTMTGREDGSWTAWSWQMVSRTEMSALPWGTVCFDDVDDPTTAHSC
ncbi:MAG: hypothetical protein ABIR39_03430 [Nocardioides sp.]|uniref:hypothetical protein n=1 Tax=Nocardioides sp. TaxID=35761 RepID=UPI003262F3EB